MFLSQTEIEELTGKKRHRSQAAELRTLGITFKIRADDTLVILRAHLEQVLGLNHTAANPSERKEPEPNWEALKNFGRNTRSKK